MDAEQFDRVAKALAQAGPRRRMVQLLAALPLGVVLASRFGATPDATAEDDDHGSSHRRHRRTARHRHRPGQDKGRNKHKTKGKGQPRKPGCTPTTCAAQGKNCGTISDGCGHPLRCGPDDCGDGYSCTDNRCLCADGTAVCEGVCCAAGQVCHEGDGPCCTPKTTCPAGQTCGTAPDACGGPPIDCGTCDASQCLTCIGSTCVSTATPNGGSCTANSECCSTICQAGTCVATVAGTCAAGLDYCRDYSDGRAVCGQGCACFPTADGGTICAGAMSQCLQVDDCSVCGAGETCVPSPHPISGLCCPMAPPAMLCVTPCPPSGGSIH